jgi:quaternary ammonium compound-resistance protein SugE
VAVLVAISGRRRSCRPVGTGYAIWAGIGGVGIAVYGMVALGEPTTVTRLLCLFAIVAGVVGLKFLH